jgi:hypothetical protein
MKPAFDKLAEEYATSSSVNIVDVVSSLTQSRVPELQPDVVDMP